jgi:hypothetical protein
MLERMMNEPWSFYGGFVVWIPLAIWIVAMVGWMITGDVDPIVGLLGIVLAFALGALTFSPPDPRLAPVFFFAVMATVLFFPVVRYALTKRALHNVDIDQIERAYNQLSLKPSNPNFEIKIARLLYDKGLPGHAVAIAERVLQNVPKQLYESEHRMLAQWRVSTRNLNLNQPVACIQCGKTNQQGLLFCERCGAPFLLDYAKGKLIGGRMARRLIGSWAAVIIATLSLPTAATMLPPKVAIPVMVGALILVGSILWVAFKAEANKA